MFILNVFDDVRHAINRNAHVETLQHELHQVQDGDGAGMQLQRCELHLALATQAPALGALEARRRQIDDPSRHWEFGIPIARQHAQHALEIARQIGNQPREADALHLLGLYYLSDYPDPSQEQSRTAQTFHEQALAIREQALGAWHPDVARSLLYIVSPGRLWAPFTPYIALAERAVQISEHALGVDHPQTIEALQQLAGLQRTTGQHAASRVILERLLAITTQQVGHENDRTAQVLYGLAWTDRALGDYDRALAEMDEVMAIRRRIFGEWYHEFVSDLSFRGDILRQQGKHQEALAAEQHVLVEFEATLGLNHPTTRSMVRNIVFRVSMHNNLLLAEQLLKRMLKSLDKDATYGPEHHETIMIAQQLVEIAQRRGNKKTADRMVMRLIATHRRATLANMSPILNLQQLFMLAWKQGDPVTIQALFEDILATYHLVPQSVEDPAVLTLLGYLSHGHDVSQLALLYERLVRATQQLHGSDHGDTAVVLIAWAEMLWSNDDTQAAIVQLEQALQIYARTHTADGGPVLATLRKIDGYLSEQGEYATVRSLYVRFLTAFEQIFGSDHPQTRDVRDRLATLPNPPLSS